MVTNNYVRLSISLFVCLSISLLSG